MADEPMSSLFERYNPQGAMGGLFAPAYIPGYAPSEAAVMAWQQQQRPVTANMIDELRMPEAYRNPPGTPPEGSPQAMMMGGGNVYGEGRIPLGLNSRLRFGDVRGRISPDVLRAAAMGGPFNVAQRRAEIEARIAQNERDEAAYREAYAAMIGGMGQGQGMLPSPG